MSDDINGSIKAFAEGAVKGLGEKIPPIYPDLFQPAVRQVGQALGMVTGLVNMALKSVISSIPGLDQMQWFENLIDEKLKEVPPENIIPPKASILGPSMLSVRFLIDEYELRDLYAQLVATSMNSKVANTAHPGFIEIIKNLSGIDAHLFSWIFKNRTLPMINELSTDHLFKPITDAYLILLCSKINFENFNYIKSSIGNLERLGLISNSHLTPYIDDSDNETFRPREVFTEFWNLPDATSWHKLLEEKGQGQKIEYCFYHITEFGSNFSIACL